MKKRIIGLLTAALVMTALTAYVFAGSKIDLEAELIFDSATSDHVIMNITNRGKGTVYISKDAYYIDEIGSPGSWSCAAAEDVTLGPNQSKYIDFYITEAVTHGDNSILAFFFKHSEHWYLAKTGKKLGFEYFSQHN